MVDITDIPYDKIALAEEKNLISAIHARDMHEVTFISRLLKKQGFLTGNDFVYAVTPEGFIRNEESKLRTTNPIQAFVAMWFSPDLTSVFNHGFQKAITETGYSPLRIDQKEHVNKIDDEIIAEIRRSRFLVADFTGHRGGVYFEAGFAMGLNLPVIWTCRKDDLRDLHFDIRQFNCIDWADADDLRYRLKYRILAVVGESPVAVKA